MFQKTQRENMSLIITDIFDTNLKLGSIEKVLCPLIIELYIIKSFYNYLKIYTNVNVGEHKFIFH